MPGLFIETLVLLPFAALYLAWVGLSGQAAFSPERPTLMLILLLAGPVTVLPLLCFALAARRLTLATIGFLQFIAPTMQFVVGLGYGERLTPARLICFALIWLAVAVFCLDAWLRGRRRRPVPSAA
jgi:chloramphenicol-sensitive protein RarD